MTEDIENCKKRLVNAISHRTKPLEIQAVNMHDTAKAINIKDIQEILVPNSTIWTEKERGITEFNGAYNAFPRFKASLPENSAVRSLNDSIDDFNKKLTKDVEGLKENKVYFEKIMESYSKGEKAGVIARVNYILNDIVLPDSMPKKWDLDFDEEQRIALVEVKLPDVTHTEVLKDVELKKSTVQKP
ncbi:MAG: hypothetical protein ACD_57C00222G0001, partial [uncultured bacterium]